MNLSKIILLGLIPLMLNACDNPDNKTIEIFFITHTQKKINNLRLTDETGYESRVGVMRAPSNLKANSFISPPTGEKGKLQWTDANGKEQSQHVDLKKLDIDPPGALFLVLHDGDVETTYIKVKEIPYTSEEDAQVTALLNKYYYNDRPYGP